MTDQVRAVFVGCSGPVRDGLLRLRGLIFAAAADHPEVGAVVESLRWGQPAYLTPETGAACSLRIGALREDGFGLFVHCQTDLIANFLAGPGAGHRHDGTRGVLFRDVTDIRDGPISMLIAGALTYHLRKRRA
ncbi:MAG: DUF1801 domain-containing protein [Paracoccaceae bacterium]